MNEDLRNNIAFIDGQNLYMGTRSYSTPWQVDLSRFRVYLNRKYGVVTAYYYLGYVEEKYQDLYEEIQRAGFVLVFRQHNEAMLGKKKGNVDTEIIFNIMKRICRKEEFDQIVLVSGDGDYKILVDFLIEENRLKKILFPDQKRASSLYRGIGLECRADLALPEVKNKIGKK